MKIQQAVKRRSDDWRVNGKWMGDEEPKWAPGEVPTPAKKGQAFDWYHYMRDVSDAKAYLDQYLLDRGIEADLKKIPDGFFPQTAGWLARMATLGADIGSSHAFIMKSISDASRKFADADDSPPKADRLKTKLETLIGDLERVVDSADWSFSPYDSLKANGFPVSVVSSIKAYYAPLAAEVDLAIQGGDPQVTEAYRSAKKAELRAKREWLGRLIADCDRYSSNERKVTAVRRKKAPSMERRLRHFLYKKEDKDLKVVSVDPALIIGASEVWTYDAKYKILTVMRATRPEGLDVKRTTVVGYDPKASITKNLGRNPGPTLGSVMKGGRSTLGRVMSEISNKPYSYIKDRNNPDVVVLRAIK